MRCPKPYVAVTAVLLASGLWAQEAKHATPQILARISYDNSGVIEEQGIRHICIAVSVNGDYRIVRSMDQGKTQRLEGKIPPEQFQQFRKAIESPELRALSGNHGGLIRQESERFAAELVRPGPPRLEDKSKRVEWLNADGEDPFPKSVARVVEWLKGFDPKDGKIFTYADYPDVCPSGGLRLLQPAVAENSAR